jgi:hypothetical protein
MRRGKESWSNVCCTIESRLATAMRSFHQIMPSKRCFVLAAIVSTDSDDDDDAVELS